VHNEKKTTENTEAKSALLLTAEDPRTQATAAYKVLRIKHYDGILILFCDFNSAF
jgi:hypothetical protein